MRASMSQHRSLTCIAKSSALLRCCKVELGHSAHSAYSRPPGLRLPPLVHSDQGDHAREDVVRHEAGYELFSGDGSVLADVEGEGDASDVGINDVASIGDGPLFFKVVRA